jgi:hypothetical protein
MAKTIFIAGKISGLPIEEARTKFDHAAHELIDMGYHVIMPVSLYRKAKNWDELTRENIRCMLDCDEVHFLPCWQQSKGAQLERDIAIRLGMNVVYH